MSQGQQPQQQFQDPKVAYLFTLNQDLEHVANALNQEVATGGRMMLAFILRLKIPDNDLYKDMKYIRDNIDMEKGISKSILHKRDHPYYRQGMPAGEIWNIWKLLADFMSNTYFKDYERGGKPEQPTVKGMKPL